MSKENSKKIPNFKPGDILSINVNVKEGQKVRQQLFKGIVADSTTDTELKAIKENLMEVTQAYFQDALSKHPEASGQLDAILSINNYDAGYAAAAHYPALTLPMGFTAQGEPKGITIITPSKNEEVIYNIAVGVESTLNARTLPEGYQE